MKVRTCSASSWPGLWTRGKDTVGSGGDAGVGCVWAWESLASELGACV